MTPIVICVLAGYLAGALIAFVLDRLYTGAPLRGPLRVCEQPVPPLLWTGTLGYLLLRGRARDGAPLPARLWYLPMVGAAAGALYALRVDDARQGVLVAIFSLVLLAFVGTDFERHLLPDRLMYPALALALAVSWAWPGRDGFTTLMGGAVGFTVMFIAYLVLPGFGFGDVKLVALMGLLVGLSNFPSALMLGVVAAGLSAVVMLVRRRAGLKTFMAYGPYLALGAFAGMLAR